MLSTMTLLTSLDISGNHIAELENYEHLHQILPRLSSLGLEGNRWNCQYLSKLIISLKSQNISIMKPTRSIKNAFNLSGHACSTNVTEVSSDANDDSQPLSQPKQMFGFNLTQTFFFLIIAIAVSLLTLCVYIILKFLFSPKRYRMSRDRVSRSNSFNTI